MQKSLSLLLSSTAGFAITQFKLAPAPLPILEPSSYCTHMMLTGILDWQSI